MIRESLQTGNWTKAQRIVNEWEARGSRKNPQADLPPTIGEVCEKFIADATARALREVTLDKYRLLFRRLTEFAQSRGVRFVTECDLDFVRDFRNSWPDKNLSALKKLERLRAFFGFCVVSKYIPENPAKLLQNPKVKQAPTLPFSRADVSKILGACDQYPDRRAAARLRALVLLLRFSGLRIRDAVTLSRDRIREDRLFVYTQKTGVPVSCPLPQVALDALAAIDDGRAYYFWSGESNPKSCVGNWQRALRLLLNLAGVKGHAHMFRDTFAVELLMAGVPLERVSVMLGHQSTRITERHYSPWVAARQEQIEADIRRAWSHDVLAAETNHTYPTREQDGRVN